MADNRIDGAPKPKLYESMEDDPAKIAEDRAKADHAKKKLEACLSDPDRIPCASPPKDQTSTGVAYTELAKTMPPKTASTAATAAIDNTTGSEQHVLPSTTNATRTAEQKDGLLVGHAGKDGVARYASLTAIKATTPNGWVAVGNVSAQGGAGVEVQAAGLRAAGDVGGGKTVSGEVLSAHASTGLGKNDNGSIGYHSGAGLTLAAIEGTQQTTDGSSGTLGLSAGVGADISVGTKTGPNGEIVACAKISVAFLTVGACHPM